MQFRGKKSGMEEQPDTGQPRSFALKKMNKVQVLLPPELGVPTNERVYALDVEILDDPMFPTERDLAIVERFGALMCEPSEVIALTGLTKEQFTSTFQGAWARGRERAKARLRLAQWDTAMMGSERMLVHLGKQYLDQTERTENTNVDEQQRKERQDFRDKLADALDRAAKNRTPRVIDGRGEGTRQEGVGAVGEGQPTSPNP